MKTTIINCDCCGIKVPETEVVTVEQYVRFVASSGGENQVYGNYYKTARVCDPETSELCLDCYKALLEELTAIKEFYKKYRNEHKEDI